jgi:GDPmannose 4,6-dehydratase
MLQQATPDDYVLASGESHSVREFVELSFKEVGIQLEWAGSGTSEKGRDGKTGRVLVEIDPRYFRPTEVEHLLGDPSKAHKVLGWRHDTGFDALVAEMVREDVKALKAERA